jgi:hypothetical protein
MSSWHYLYIDDPTQALLTSRRFADAVYWADIASRSGDAAIFSRVDDDGGMHYYFTPAAQAVAEAFGAAACSKPDRKDLGGLLVGDKTLITRLYQ